MPLSQSMVSGAGSLGRRNAGMDNVKLPVVVPPVNMQSARVELEKNPTLMSNMSGQKSLLFNMMSPGNITGIPA